MIIIDGYPTILPPCGIKSFSISFLKSLANNKHSTKNEYLLAIPKPINLQGQFDNHEMKLIKNLLDDNNIKVIEYPLNSFLILIAKLLSRDSSTLRRYILFIWSFYTFPRIAKSNNPEKILHLYQVISNYKTNAKKYVVVHDIFHWIDTGRYSKIIRHYYLKSAIACKNTAKILTISNYSKLNIQNILQIDENQIEVCYEGVDDLFLNPKFSKEKIISIKEKYRLPNKYILGFLSQRIHKKNVLGTLKVFHEIRILDKYLEYKLVLLGGNLNTNTEVKEFIKKNNLMGEIIFIPGVELIEELSYFYHLSQFYVFLSLEEGFGLPPLEALGCNTFPITSNNSSLGEIYGDYIPTFDPNDHKEIAKFIMKLKDEERIEIINKARKILLSKYSWEVILPNYLKFIS
jgi:glycosyltransferase involved in cell wall biosynthesis